MTASIHCCTRRRSSRVAKHICDGSIVPKWTSGLNDPIGGVSDSSITMWHWLRPTVYNIATQSHHNTSAWPANQHHLLCAISYLISMHRDIHTQHSITDIISFTVIVTPSTRIIITIRSHRQPRSAVTSWNDHDYKRWAIHFKSTVSTTVIHLEKLDPLNWFISFIINNINQLLSASLYFSKRGAYWDRLCRDVGWLSRACTVAKRCILGL